MSREEKIGTRKDELTKQFSKLDTKRKKIVSSLIDNAAFMAVKLEELRSQIDQVGMVSEYQNGANQWGTKKSPEIEIYNTIIKNHMTIIKQLTDLLPKEEQKEADDGFESFVTRR